MISEAEAAEARYRKAMEGAGDSQRMVRLHPLATRRRRNSFDAGYVDRVELTLTQIETLAAQRNALAPHGSKRSVRWARLEDALQIPLVGGPLPELGTRDQETRSAWREK